VAHVVALSGDLMFASRIEATLRAAGHDVHMAPSLAEADLESAELLVADLDEQQPAALSGLSVPVLGYYSHVNVETKRAAAAAGIERAVPRSRMAREMAELVERALSGS
jgi:hypothetical protein